MPKLRTNPYTYLIGWTKLKLYYYGVRYSKDSYVGDIWKIYYTSSSKVHKTHQEYGEPDIIQVRRVFKTKEKAIAWEVKVLRRMRAPLRDDFLNQHCSPAAPTMRGLNNPAKRQDVRNRLSEIAKNRPKMGKDVIEKIKQTKTMNNLIQFLKNRKSFIPCRAKYMQDKLQKYRKILSHRNSIVALTFVDKCINLCNNCKKAPRKYSKRGKRGKIPKISKSKIGKKWYYCPITKQSKLLLQGTEPFGWVPGLLKKTPNNNTPEVKAKISEAIKKIRASETAEKKSVRLKKYHDTIKKRKSCKYP